MMTTTPSAARESWLSLSFATLACLILAGAGGRTQAPPPDQGAPAAWQKLIKLRTTASAMHTTAHPDDEHGGVLALLSRGQGARVSLLTLTRGESGDNAIGSELFDALGLLRTEELLVADRYYGVDRQYFGTMVDYGFSKRLDETLEKWGKDQALRDVVRAIRTERPFVLISRFQGNARDGHGNHSAAGLVTQEAFELAGDPAAFPEQIAAGLRPWQPFKLYIGGVRENEDWTLRVDAGEYDPMLGDSYQSFARLGLSFQRSQNSGRVSRQPGPSVSYYKRLTSLVDAPAKERGFFDGIDTTLPGLFRTLGKTSPADAAEALIALDREIQAAVQAFQYTDPSAAAPALGRALSAARALQRKGVDPDVAFVLARKEEQIADALSSVLGIAFTAVAQPPGAPESSGPFAGGPPPMPPVVPGQDFEVRAAFANRSRAAVNRVAIDIRSTNPAARWRIAPVAGGPVTAAEAAPNQPIVAKFSVRVPENAAVTRPHFSRTSIQESRYTISDERYRDQPASAPPLEAVAGFDLNGVRVELRRPVVRMEPNLPYGYDTRLLSVVPTIAVMVSPAIVVTPLNAATKKASVKVEILNNVEGKVEGTLRLDVPADWTVVPTSRPLAFSRAGERALYTFEIQMPSLTNRDYRVEAVAASAGREYREGYTIIRHRDLETRNLYRPATATIRGVDVRIASGLRVGYVMGVGDEVPSGLAQLGVDVRLLGEADLATGDLSRFDTIMTGTRAYAVREDLKTYNRRLLDYVQAGGNLIVLYNTQEFVPDLYAPYPASLPASAEEVSEEDSPLEILAPRDRVFQTPNQITSADFEHWVEQRGSKFWSAWDSRYTPLVATWDKGQAPQKGGWLHAQYGKGHYTYFAYAFHRQLPYGVPGAFRLLANLLSLNQPRVAAAQSPAGQLTSVPANSAR